MYQKFGDTFHIKIGQHRGAVCIKAYLCFCAHLQCNSRNVCCSEKWSEQKQYRKTKHILFYSAPSPPKSYALSTQLNRKNAVCPFSNLLFFFDTIFVIIILLMSHCFFILISYLL
jgi:hypothetical protein